MEEKRLKISGISETSKIQELEQISDPGFYVAGQALRNLLPDTVKLAVSLIHVRQRKGLCCFYLNADGTHGIVFDQKVGN